MTFREPLDSGSAAPGHPWPPRHLHVHMHCVRRLTPVPPARNDNGIQPFVVRVCQYAGSREIGQVMQ
jgi:hypothetical protein